MKFLKKPSPNFNNRPKGAKPELIVIHYTATPSAQSALNHLSNPKSQVSAHYLIDEKGNVYQMVDEQKRAWHAGKSNWQGKPDVNSRSIGIEISNDGKAPYTDAQQGVLVLLCRDLMQRHNIPPQNIIGHSDIAPGRKQDPGAHFPWEKLAGHDIGLWPKPNLKDAFNARAVAKDDKRLRDLFAQAGYGVAGVKTKDLVTAFQSRYEPDIFKAPARVGTATPDTVAKLRALIRQSGKAAP